MHPPLCGKLVMYLNWKINPIDPKIPINLIIHIEANYAKMMWHAGDEFKNY